MQFGITRRWVRGILQIVSYTLVLIGTSGKIDWGISYDLVLGIDEGTIMGGWIVFDGKSGRFCPGTDLFLSLPLLL